MSRQAAFTQLDIERAVRGCLKGGWPIGSFKILVHDGTLEILPVAVAPSNDDDRIDAEIAALLHDNG